MTWEWVILILVSLMILFSSAVLLAAINKGKPPPESTGEAVSDDQSA